MKNPKVTAINSCIEIDLTGQVREITRPPSPTHDGLLTYFCRHTGISRLYWRTNLFWRGRPNGLCVFSIVGQNSCLFCAAAVLTLCLFTVMRGAALSEGGKPIIALASTTSKGASKIVPTLKPGAGVVTTRAHVHYVVTEWGVANLFGLNLQDRAKALIKIAHPSHREALERAVAEQYWKHPKV